MGLKGRRYQLLVGVVVLLLVYVGFVMLITMANNGWYPFLTAEFCGSLGDFTDNPVTPVCLSFSAYWVRAALHLPFALAGVILAGIIASIVVFRSELKAKVRS